jgi:hypothetical protein
MAGDLACGHDVRFRIWDAENGCLACQCELEAREKTKAREELASAREKVSGYEKQLVKIADLLGGDARDCEGEDKSIAGLVSELHAKWEEHEEAVGRLKECLLGMPEEWPAASGSPCDIAVMLLSKKVRRKGFRR